MSDLGGVWRTVGGRRIFIKDGQDLKSAMTESGKFKQVKKKKRTLKDIKREEVKDIHDLQRIAHELDVLPSELQDELGITDRELGLVDEYAENFEREMQEQKRYVMAEEAKKATSSKAKDDQKKKDMENDLRWFEEMEEKYPTKGGLAKNEDYQTLKEDYEANYKTKWNGAKEKQETQSTQDLKKENKLDKKKINDTFRQLKEDYHYGYRKEEDKKIEKQTEELLKNLEVGTELGQVSTESMSGWTSYGSYHDERAKVTKYKKIGENEWEGGYGKKDNHDMMLTALHNTNPLMDLETAKKVKEEQSINDKSTYRDIINTGTDQWGNKVGQSFGRIEYTGLENAYKKYMAEHPNSEMTIEDFKKKYGKNS